MNFSNLLPLTYYFIVVLLCSEVPFPPSSAFDSAPILTAPELCLLFFNCALQKMALCFEIFLIILLYANIDDTKIKLENNRI